MGLESFQRDSRSCTAYLPRGYDQSQPKRDQGFRAYKGLGLLKNYLIHSLNS